MNNLELLRKGMIKSNKNKHHFKRDTFSRLNLANCVGNLQMVTLSVICRSKQSIELLPAADDYDFVT